MDLLRNKFNNFKRKCSESVQDTYSRLVIITNELKGLDAKDVQNHDVVKKLCGSLDDSFNTPVTMIQGESTGWPRRRLRPSTSMPSLMANPEIVT